MEEWGTTRESEETGTRRYLSCQGPGAWLVDGKSVVFTVVCSMETVGRSLDRCLLYGDSWTQPGPLSAL
ncbi:hypothetical protein ACOMHN_055345 [Nucella lapillus]